MRARWCHYFKFSFDEGFYTINSPTPDRLQTWEIRGFSILWGYVVGHM